MTTFIADHRVKAWYGREKKEGCTAMARKLDDHGQPNFQDARGLGRLTDRVIDELVGMCRGVIMDGVVTEGEAATLLSWIERQHYAKHEFPADVLASRLKRVLQDGRLDSEEAKDLFELLTLIVGGEGDQYGPATTQMPLDDPQPQIVFPHRKFVITGRFAYGPRRTVEDSIKSFKGQVAQCVSLQVDYLVCGYFSSRDWIHSNLGRKIEAACALRDRDIRCTSCGCKIKNTMDPCQKCGETDFPGKIAIVSEEHWLRALSASTIA